MLGITTQLLHSRPTAKVEGCSEQIAESLICLYDLPEADEQPCESSKAVLILSNLLPINPVELTVMAVCVVVALLAVPKLIAHLQHGHTMREK